MSNATVSKDFNKNVNKLTPDEKNITEYEDVTSESVNKLTPPEIPGWMDEGGGTCQSITPDRSGQIKKDVRA